METTQISQTQTCETCKYFHRHYVKGGRKIYIPLDRGHCANPRCRDKLTNTPACWRFCAGKGDRPPAE